MPTRDDDDFETSPGRQPLPDGWVSVGPNLLLRVDGMRLTTPDPTLWDLELLGDCPFVVEVTRESERGPDRAQRPLVASRLIKACQEANERFPIPSWFMETVVEPPQRLHTEAQDKGWFVVPRSRGAVVVEGIELDEPDAAARYSYVAGTKLWSPSAFRVEKNRAAHRMARWRRFRAERGG